MGLVAGKDKFGVGKEKDGGGMGGGVELWEEKVDKEGG